MNTLNKNLARLLESWRDRRSSLEGAERRLLNALESELSHVMQDNGRSHLVSARAYEMLWAGIPEIVLIHDGDRVQPGRVYDYDGDSKVLLLVECSDGAQHAGVPFGAGTDDATAYWTWPDAISLCQARRMFES